jgi:hypothetical protein
MKRKLAITSALLCVTLFVPLSLFAQENLSSVSRTVDFNIRDSVDNSGNLYIRYHGILPSVLTFVNSDGSVTVCTSDERAGTTYIYEYDIDLEEQGTLELKNELGSLGAFTKDNEGNYYFFYGLTTSNRNAESMAVVKYSREGERVKTYRLRANAPNSFDGVQTPFDSGTCRLELSGSMLAVYFARKMFNGHQASYGFVLDKDTFERIDRGAATNDSTAGGNTQIPYSSHSFNQFILPIEGGFIFADHGDAYPRSFTFARFINRSNTKRLHAFTFPGGIGANATYAQMGGLAKTSTGYIFAGTYGRDLNTPRNLFILTFDNNLNACSNPVYLTSYTRNDGHAGHPKIVSLNDGRYLLLWEKFSFSTQAANSITGARTGYLSTFALVINERGNTVSAVQELERVRLNINDTLRYNPHNGKAYWAVNDSGRSITVYALDVNSEITNRR